MLQLAALDEDDLKVVSAMAQDALVLAGDINRVGPGAFSLVMNRYAWDAKAARGHGERRRSVLHFSRVTSARFAGFDRTDPDTILSLLAVRFEPGEAPSGVISLDFSGTAAIRLGVECIECSLSDMGAAWSAQSRPSHDV
jgi:hypothetical protein